MRLSDCPATAGEPSCFWWAALCGCLLGALGSTGCEQQPPAEAKAVAPPAAPPPPVPPPPPSPPMVNAINNVVCKPGETASVPVEIFRNGNEGVVELSVNNPPKGISAKRTSIPADSSSCQLEVRAADTLGEEEVQVTVPLTVIVNGSSVEATFQVTVPQYEPPQFRLDEGLILVQGSTRDVTVHRGRQGYQGGVDLAIGEEVPEGVSCDVAPIGPHADSTSIRIAVAEAAADGIVTIPLVATLNDRSVTSELSFAIKRYPFRIGGPKAVVLAPGESRDLVLPIERNGYDGPVDMTVVDLPSGVVVPPVVADTGSRSVSVEIRCDPEAPEAIRSGAIRCQGGDLRLTSPLVVRVSAGEQRSLPAVVSTVPRAIFMLRKGSFGGRMTFESKQALRDLYGGTVESDAAVMRGLRWLASVQAQDGGWLPQGVAGGPDTGPAAGPAAGPAVGSGFEHAQESSAIPQPAAEPQPAGENRITATAWGLLPFLAEGITHKTAPEKPPTLAAYESVVERGLVFLATQQNRFNQPRSPNDGYFGADLVGQALATIAFCEASALSRDSKPRLHAQKAVGFLLRAQNPASGGWGYVPHQSDDLAVTSVVIVALRSAQLANISVKPDRLRAAEDYVRSCAIGATNAGGLAAPDGSGPDAAVAITGAGLLARLYLGSDRDAADIAAGSEFLMANLPPLEPGTLGDLFAYACATEALFHLEGEAFDTWNHLIREHLIRSQNSEGGLAGSWDPRAAEDGGRGGRISSTALALLTLQVYYRHLPLFREPAEPPAS
jgi:hypothetical protein